jgi:hypothetical protein
MPYPLIDLTVPADRQDWDSFVIDAPMGHARYWGLLRYVTPVEYNIGFLDESLRTLWNKSYMNREDYWQRNQANEPYLSREDCLIRCAMEMERYNRGPDHDKLFERFVFMIMANLMEREESAGILHFNH